MRVLPTVEPSEAAFQKSVMDLLAYHRWRRVHFRPGMSSKGRWATHGDGETAGWPDVVACRGNRILALELKRDKGRVTAAQQDWLDALGHAGVEAHVCRPRDWDWLERLVK